MLVSRKSWYSGEVNVKNVPITMKQYNAYLASNQVPDNFFPHLEEEDKEFLFSGITLEEQQKMENDFFNDDDEAL